MGYPEKSVGVARLSRHWVSLKAVLEAFPGCSDHLHALISSGDVAAGLFGGCYVVDDMAIQALLKPLDLAEAKERFDGLKASPPSRTDTLLTLTEAAVHCAVSPRTVRHAIRSGQLSARRRGSGKLAQYIISLDDLQQWKGRDMVDSNDLYQLGMKVLGDLEGAPKHHRSIRARGFGKQ